jgi:hypothetical protein
MASVFANYKAKRIERILSAPPSTILSLPWVKRALSIIAVVSSYLALAGLLFAPFVADRSHYASDYLGLMLVASYLPWVMLIAFVLLRRSTRRITSLPDEYLDEREQANRDWAFRMGYVVIRRVGLGITSIFVLAICASYLRGLFFWTWTSDPTKSLLYIATQAVNDYLKAMLGEFPLAYLAGYITLLTYVAYAFPVILLAWREARTVHVVEAPKDASAVWSPELTRLAKGYRFRMIFVLSPIALALAVLALNFLTSSWPLQSPFAILLYLVFSLLVPWALYSIYVYFWALVAQIKIVRLLGMPGIPQKASAARAPQLVILAFTAVLGIAVPISMYVGSAVPSYGSVFPLGYAFIAGLALIVLQVASFVNANRLAKSV